MATLTVPPRHYAGIAAIRALPEEQFEQILNLLKGSPVSATASEMAELVSQQISGLDLDTLKTLLETVLSLYVVRVQAEVDVDTFVQDLRVGLNETGDPKLAVVPEQAELFTQRFGKLFRIERIEVTSKAIGLKHDYENTFCDAKVITDIRPVFGNSTEDPPIMTVITHSLKIEYHHSSRHKQMYIAIDSGDIDTLIEVLERARAKAKTLAVVMSKAEIPHLPS
jgi:hypothetical protein